MKSHKSNTGIFDGLSDSDVDRTAALDRFFIPHSRAELIQAAADRLFREAKRNSKLAGRAIMFTGVSGVGKSEALQVFAELITKSELEKRGADEDGMIADDDGLTKRRIIPVVYINVPESASLKDFYTTFLKELGNENPIGTVASMRSRVKLNLKEGRDVADHRR